MRGALPPNPRSLSHEPIPAGGKSKSPAVIETTGPDAVHRTGGHRVALLRSPVLPSAAPVVEEKTPIVQRQAIPGVGPAEANRTFLSAGNTGHFYLRLTP